MSSEYYYGDYIKRPDPSTGGKTAINYRSIEGFDITKTPLVDYSDNNVFLGVPNVTQNTLPFFEPFIGGYGRVFCLHAPVFFDTALRLLTMRLIERFCKGLSGLSDYELQTASVTYGNNAEEMYVPTGIKKGNTQFSLKYTEQQGSIFRKIFKYWITGIADIGTGYGIYHGKVFSQGLRFSAINHTAIILYALTDNSGGAYGLDSIEFACMWYGAFPTQVKNSHFEYSIGEHSTADMDQSFYGIYHENNTVAAFAAEMLRRSNFYRDNYNNFNLGSIVYDALDRRLGVKEPEYYNFEPMQKDANQFDDIVNIEGLSHTDPAKGKE